jgi:sialidase-1
VENTEIHLWFSSDEGETWEGPFKTPCHGIVPERLYELKSGRWLLAAHHKNPETGKLTEYVWYTDDQGETWSERICLAMDARYNLCEVGLVEVEPNVVVGFLRENSMQGWDCFKAISRDGGKTWEGVYNVPIPGCHRPTVGLLQDGRLLVTYRYLQGGWSGWGHTTQNVQGALMLPEMITATDRKRQWVRIFPIDYDRNEKADLGYTGWVQFEDGEIYIVNYIVDDAPKAQIRGYSLRPDELTIEN